MFEMSSDGDRGPVESARQWRLINLHSKVTRVVIICGFFAALMGIASLVGVQKMIDTSRREAEALSDSHRVSRVVYTLRDKTFCRHVSFDNVSGQISEEGTRLCDPNAASQRDFVWGRK